MRKHALDDTAVSDGSEQGFHELTTVDRAHTSTTDSDFILPSLYGHPTLETRPQ
jgi:hypothetical protein